MEQSVPGSAGQRLLHVAGALTPCVVIACDLHGFNSANDRLLVYCRQLYSVESTGEQCFLKIYFISPYPLFFFIISGSENFENLRNIKGSLQACSNFSVCLFHHAVLCDNNMLPYTRIYSLSCEQNSALAGSIKEVQQGGVVVAEVQKKAAVLWGFLSSTCR